MLGVPLKVISANETVVEARVEFRIVTPCLENLREVFVVKFVAIQEASKGSHAATMIDSGGC